MAREIACSSCEHALVLLPASEIAPYYAYDGVFCTECKRPFCRPCLEFHFVNESGGAKHVDCGGYAKVIRVKRPDVVIES